VRNRRKKLRAADKQDLELRKSKPHEKALSSRRPSSKITLT
jgi:hypothetical protein